MNLDLYLLTQERIRGWDTYDAVIVAAWNSWEARRIRPEKTAGKDTWPTPEHVEVKLLGRAVRGTPSGTILASFNAG